METINGLTPIPMLESEWAAMNYSPDNTWLSRNRHRPDTLGFGCHVPPPSLTQAEAAARRAAWFAWLEAGHYGPGFIGPRYLPAQAYADRNKEIIPINR